MKVKDYHSYDPECPETFTWGWVDQISLRYISLIIVSHIGHDLRQDRKFTPGLRVALNIIADIAEIASVR